MDIDINTLFHAKSDGDYTVLEFKNPLDKVIIFDPGLYHTAICKSALSKVDTKDGKLYYRKEPVETKTSEDFLDVAGFLLFGKDKNTIDLFKIHISKYLQLLPEQKRIIDSLPEAIHPMDALAISTISLSGIEQLYIDNPNDPIEKAAFLVAQVAEHVTYYYTKIRRLSWSTALPDVSYAGKILTQMQAPIQLHPILNAILILHAEHGLNCSAATVRNIASSKGSIYAAVAAGMGAFNGRIHGGASQLVSEMYQEIYQNNLDIDAYIDAKKASKQLLMGFGQRTYNRIPGCWDPRVEVMHKLLVELEIEDKEIEQYRRIALALIDRVIKDPFYQAKNLTPNPDLFNCIFYKLFGAPKEMNTCMLALGRIVGWVANFMEHSQHQYPLTRPCDISL